MCAGAAVASAMLAGVWRIDAPASAAVSAVSQCAGVRRCGLARLASALVSQESAPLALPRPVGAGSPVALLSRARTDRERRLERDTPLVQVQGADRRRQDRPQVGTPAAAATDSKMVGRTAKRANSLPRTQDEEGSGQQARIEAESKYIHLEITIDTIMNLPLEMCGSDSRLI